MNTRTQSPIEKNKSSATVTVFEGKESRSKFITTCKNCNITAKSEITIQRNLRVDTLYNKRRKMGILFKSIFVVIAISGGITGIAIKNYILGGVSLGIALGFLALFIYSDRQLLKNIDNKWADVIHFCPECKFQIGISDGYNQWELDEEARKKKQNTAGPSAGDNNFGGDNCEVGGGGDCGDGGGDCGGGDGD